MTSPDESVRAAHDGGWGANSSPGAPFHSILFEHADRRPDLSRVQEPDFFGDLNLDQVLEAMTAGREQYDLKPFFYAPLHDVAQVEYRHAVLRDLEKPEVSAPVIEFAQQMKTMREHLANVEKMYYKLQKQAWFRDAVEIYCQAARLLAEALAGCDVASPGLDAFREYLRAYLSSGPFTALEDEAREVKDGLASVEYSIHIHGNRVRVRRYEGEPDYGAEVAATFAKFQQGAVKSYLVQLPEFAEMNHVEAQVLGCVARLYPRVFRDLDEFCARHAEYLDETLAGFDREVQFYLGYLELIGRLRSAGLSFCYPQVSARSKEILVEDSFDLALANKLVAEGGKVVCNGFYLEEPERMFVVSGPNNGGKTTFARMFGQLHYLASLGLLVPGRSARLFLPDRVFTHFEREEDIETLRGKLEDELVRVHAILEQATSDSVIVMNESFNSTTLDDAVFLGTEVMSRILEIGCLGVYVTFVDELASLSDATVSMVSQIVPENPAERTFKIFRQPADGLAYAWAIAEKYGLTYERLKERVTS
jgi:DNA mismatch repair protein MutS